MNTVNGFIIQDAPKIRLKLRLKDYFGKCGLK
jgi:hypothetical protein